MDKGKLLGNFFIGVCLLGTAGIYANVQGEDSEISDEGAKEMEAVYRKTVLLEEAYNTFYQIPSGKKWKNDTAGNRAHDPALIEAVQNSDESALKAFLDQGIDINAQDSEGETLLFRFVRSFPSKDDESERAKRAIELLLDSGADPNVRNFLGFSPLHAALCLRLSQVMRLLLERGANIDAPKGCRLLHNEIAKGNLEFVQLLLTYGANANQTDGSGQTALDVAIAKKAKISDDNEERISKYNQIIELLLEHGATDRADAATDAEDSNSEN